MTYRRKLSASEFTDDDVTKRADAIYSYLTNADEISYYVWDGWLFV